MKPSGYTRRMKGVLILMLTGALVGIAIASTVVPPMLGWYTSPGGLPAGAQIELAVGKRGEDHAPNAGHPFKHRRHPGWG